MPRACPVECHAGRYTELQVTILDATGLPRGVSRWPLYRTTSHHPECHGLAPWRVHASRYTELQVTILDATGLSRGGFTLAATPIPLI